MIPAPKVYYHGTERNTLKSICARRALEYSEAENDAHQYAIIDLRVAIDELKSLEDWKKLRQVVFVMCSQLFAELEDRRFITVIAKNRFFLNDYHPIAWDLGYLVSSVFSLKDEKIGCITSAHSYSKILPQNGGQETFYVLNFRKDEKSPNSQTLLDYPYSSVKSVTLDVDIPQWFILKPQRRSKDEILHPAKYPEDLVEMYVSVFTKPGDNVFDPMSGTGSTQVAAIKLGRNGYGTELSEFFGKIAQNRCREAIEPAQGSLFPQQINATAEIIISDARDFKKHSFPKQNYIITSPPYWDMLNMKGAENQSKRNQSGLRTNYSEDGQDMGNISDYKYFLDSVVTLYRDLSDLIMKGSKVTLVVKNIKKKGDNYPFAWDLCRELQGSYLLLPEGFWLQDDISIAPFGYGNTWVSNTFHQYCLNFQKR